MNPNWPSKSPVLACPGGHVLDPGRSATYADGVVVGRCAGCDARISFPVATLSGVIPSIARNLLLCVMGSRKIASSCATHGVPELADLTRALAWLDELDAQAATARAELEAARRIAARLLVEPTPDKVFTAVDLALRMADGEVRESQGVTVRIPQARSVVDLVMDATYAVDPSKLTADEFVRLRSRLMDLLRALESSDVAIEARLDEARPAPLPSFEVRETTTNFAGVSLDQVERSKPLTVNELNKAFKAIAERRAARRDSRETS